MKKINILISWTGDNYCAGTNDVEGVVMATSKTFDAIKKEFGSALAFHLEDNDSIDNYEFNYELQTSALLRKLDGILTRSALSRITGINEQQLSHYITGHKNPRKKNRQRIIDGIHTIGNELISVV